MFKIISVNGIKYRDRFDRVRIDGTPLRSGRSENFYVSTKEELEQKIDELALSCEQNDINLILFASREPKGKTTECVVYGEDEDSSRIYKKLVYLIGLCEKAVYDGQDFIVVIDNANVIEEMLERFENDVSSRIKKYLQSTLPRFVQLGNIQILFRFEREVEY